MKSKIQVIVQEVNRSPSSEPNRTRARTPNNPLTSEEVDKLLSNINIMEDKVLLTFGFSAGVRVGEVPSLEPMNINEAEQCITIWDEKKDKQRTIFLPLAVITLLKAYWDQRADKSSPRYFNYSKKTIERKIQHWTQKVLAKKKSWHCVRHTYITLSSERKIPIEIVINNTGDKPSTILQYYSHPSAAFIRKEIEEKKLFKVL